MKVYTVHACPPGHRGDGRGESCVLCSATQYQDESGQKQCKECTTDLCAAVPGATTNQAEGEDTLHEEYCDEHQLELD